MQSKQINLRLKPSKLPLIALFLIFVCGYIISRYIPGLRYIVSGVFIVFCLLWLYRYLNFKEFTLIINTGNNTIILNNSPVQAIKFWHICWWLSVIHLTVSGKMQTIYLFVDSATFKQYKSFKIYSQWT
ncbi:MAG: hypothetical protein K0R94_1088 [Burkholderiales bacterium]|jgi:hypothetical protein|nr:hypothetical protein [Burkholderiales bacterium]